jgi:O-antigen ligase
MPVAASAVIALSTLAVLLALPPFAAGWLVLGTGAVIAIVVYPFTALALMPFAVAYGSLVGLDLRGVHAGPTDLLVGGLLLASVWRFVRRSPVAMRTPAVRIQRGRAWISAVWRDNRTAVVVYIGLVAYLAAVMLSLLAATSRPQALKEVVKWAEVIVVVSATLWLVRSVARVRLLAWLLIASSISEAILGYIQWILARGDAGPGGADIRVFGTFAQPNPFAAYLNFGLILALSLVIFGRDARERWLAGAAGAITLGALVLAGSRGALLGLLAALVIMLIVGFRLERPALIAAATGVPVVLVAWFGHLIPSRIETRLLESVRVADLSTITSANFSTQERLAHWVAGLRMFAAHPLIGVGAGNYNDAYSQYANVAIWPEALGQAHNYYINAAAETGLVGLIAFLFLVATLLYAGWRASGGSLRARRQRELGSREVLTRAFAIGFLGILIAVCVHNLTDDLFVHAMELQIAMSVGCLIVLNVERQRAK